MFRKLTEFALVALTGTVAVAPALAQNSVSQIDSEHSTARLYLASSKNPNGNVNVGVARMAGVVKMKAGNSTTPNFDFTIYPADEKPSPANSEASRGDDRSNYTVIAFKSRRAVSLGGDTFRVSGDLTVTNVQRVSSDLPSEGYSGSAYGPSITSSQTQQVSFEFRRATRSGSSGNGEWIASTTILGEDFPELLTAVSSTVLPVFVADRKALRCETPATVGEDFAGEVCTQVDTPVTIADPHPTLSVSSHDKNVDPSRVVADEVQIQLDLITIGSSSMASLASGQ
jgi:hypothetical protein